MEQRQTNRQTSRQTDKQTDRQTDRKLNRQSDCVCEVGTVSKISDCQPEGAGFNSPPGRGLNFGRPSFATTDKGQGR